MLFYDTDTNRLLTYTGGKWQSTGGEYTIVAASDSPQAIKDAADYVTDGDNVAGAGTIDGDQIEINAALTAAAGGKVYLAQGTYVADATILIPNNTTLAGAGRGTLIELGDIDVADNLIEATGASRSGQIIRDLRLDGRKDLNTFSTQRGIYFNGVGAGTGSTARQGAKLLNLWINNFHNNGVEIFSSHNSIFVGNSALNNYNGFCVNSSTNNTITGNNTQGNNGSGIYIYSGSTYNTITGNTSQGNNEGIQIIDNYNTVSGNTVQGNGYGVDVSGDYNTITGNTATGNSWGIYLYTANSNTISGNSMHDSGSSTNNNGIYLSSSDSNTITSNSVTDSSATTTNYAINIFNSTSDTNYLADNTLGGGSINDAGTGTIYGGQVDGSGNYDIQPSGSISLLKNTDVTGALTTTGNATISGGTLTVGTTSQAGSLVINDGTTNTVSIVSANQTGNFSATIPILTANDTFCLVIKANCTGGGGGANTSLSNLASVDINAALNATSNNLSLTTTTSGNIVLNSAGTIELQDNTNITGNLTISANSSLLLTGGTTLNRPTCPCSEGTLFYDTDTNRLLTYTGGKWQATGGEYTIVAAANSPQAIKDAADYVADGTADEVEINAALTAAAGGKVYLAQGTYVANATILIPNNTTLAGAGSGTKVNLVSASSSENLIENLDTATGTGITVRDLWLDGSSSSGATQRGVYLNGVGSASASERDGARLQSILISSFSAHGLVLTGTTQRVFIEGVTAENNTDHGFYILGSYNVLSSNISRNNSENGFYLFGAGATHNTLKGNTSTGNAIYGIGLVSDSSNNTVTGNTTQSNNYGIYTASSSGNTITGNTVQGNTSGIYSYSGTGTAISGNAIRGNNSGIVIEGVVSYSLSGNSINESAISGITVRIFSQNNTLSGNTISNSGGASNNNGIYLDRADSNTITGNTITDSSATTTNYAINIFDSGSDTNYLADNTIGGGSINDAGTGTIYGGQLNAANQLQQTAAAGVLIKNDSATAFQVQNSSGNELLKVDTTTTSVNFGKASALTGKLVIYNSANSNAITITAGTTAASGYTLTLPTTVGSAGDCLKNSGTAGILTWGSCGGGGGGTKTIKLIPEFAGGTLSADGSNNSGAMTADYDSTNRHSYYEWSTGQATAQDYDVIVRWQVPSDYTGGMSTASNYKFYIYDGDGATTTAQVTWTMEDASGTQCFSSVFNGTAASTWEQKSASTLGSCSFTADDIITFKFKMQATTGSGAIRVGEVELQYSN